MGTRMRSRVASPRKKPSATKPSPPPKSSPRKKPSTPSKKTSAPIKKPSSIYSFTSDSSASEASESSGSEPDFPPKASPPKASRTKALPKGKPALTKTFEPGMLAEAVYDHGKRLAEVEAELQKEQKRNRVPEETCKGMNKCVDEKIDELDKEIKKLKASLPIAGDENDAVGRSAPLPEPD